MVSYDAPPHYGGMGRHVGSLIDALRACGITVELFDRSSRPIATTYGRHLSFSIGLSGALSRWAAQKDIHMLHIHAGPGGVFLPAPPLPCVVTANHTYIQQSSMPGESWKKIFLPLERSTYQAACAIACISTDTAKSVTESYGVPEGKILTIPCGFDVLPWIQADTDDREAYHCIFVGRPDVRKGYDILLRAWKHVIKAYPHARLHLVGVSGHDTNSLKFYRRVSDDVLRTMVGRARCLIAPSRLEGFGLAAAEAIAAGTPVIATNVDGLRTVVSHGLTGLLSGCDAFQLAHNISRLFSDDVLWKTLHEGCQSVRHGFSETVEAHAYASLYSRVYSSLHA